MKAVRFHKFGPPEVLKVEDVPKPTAGPGQVLIKVKAIGINPVENLWRTGLNPDLPLPTVLGDDCAGVVESVGSGVTKFKDGDRVLTFKSVTGTYAEFTVADVAYVSHLPDRLSFAQGAGVGTPYATAYTALTNKAKPKEGETLLVHGASGSVGLATVQYGRHLGLKVLGTAGSKAGLDLVKRTGADLTFNHREEGYVEKIKQAVGEKGVDIILEVIASAHLGDDLELAGRRARIVVVGTKGPAKIQPMHIFMKELSIIGIEILSKPDNEWGAIRDGTHKGLEDGWFKPVIAKSYKLSDVVEAHKDLITNKGNTAGKLVMEL